MAKEREEVKVGESENCREQRVCSMCSWSSVSGGWTDPGF